MTTQATYKILAVRSYYGPYDMVSEYTDDRYNAVIYGILDEARAAADDLDNSAYYLAHNESGRADYLIVEADYQIGFSDLSDYNWDDSECDCGQCDTCHAMMQAQDVEFSRQADLRGAK